MRLNSIKLSGFKSFAEPTQLQLPGRLVGVVGPNGCGKSNVMDAVRWVLGESKASELRGESMQDVIFNGSGLRKPASRASVELIFNNEDARAGGQWNQFTEIAVKRVLTRDGTSSYYINGQPVRRRDVHDVFLGTGLGPRAYAIIGQGTISRIIESKPEELRMFLEEAAGVSKYKERRRETENRLKDTRDNLNRVEDILRELASNLEKLESQAEVASRYRALQAHAVLRQHQLWFLKHRDASKERMRLSKAVSEALSTLEERTAELRRSEAQLETVRQAHYQANDALHASQGLLGEAALEVSRFEERIRFVNEGRQRLEQRRVELIEQMRQWEQRRAQALAEKSLVAAEIVAADEQCEVSLGQVREQADVIPALDDAVATAQSAANAQRSLVAGVQQQIQVLAEQTRHIEEQQRGLRQRRERLHAELTQLSEPDLHRLAELEHESGAAKQAQLTAEASLSVLAENLPRLDSERRAAQAQVNLESRQHAELNARLDALRALQVRVQTQGKLKPWLERHGLDGLQGLWTRIQIEAGWETALESALRERLNALEVGRIETVRAFAGDSPPAKLAFYTAPLAAIRHTHQTLPRLADLLRLGDAGLQALLNDWLQGVYTAAGIDEALAARAMLTHGEVIMTREGHAVSQFAVSFYAPDTENAGMLARAQEMQNLERQLRAQGLIAEEAHAKGVRCEAGYTEASQRLEQLRREAALAQTRAHQLQVECLRLSQISEQTDLRRGQLASEFAEIEARAAELDARRAGGEVRFEEFDRQLADTQQEHADLEEAQLAAQRALNAAREALRALERQAQEAAFGARSLAAREAELERNIATAAQQITATQQSSDQLTDELGRLSDAAAQSGLQTALALKLERESALAALRSVYDDLSLRLRQADEQRLQREQSLQPMRERIVKLQLEEQAAQLGGAQYLEQLESARADLDALAAGITAEGVKLGGLQAEIDAVQGEMAALGAVNLAALEELNASRERKAFLDAQHADLVEAMNTLEDAIHKIDVETRELLGATFNQVNEHFGRMFPTLFGGGVARLVMTGDQILDAGVQVMAQPPGKKNSTIHLMSGGEKALTAIALVFAIFQLNPAPFCLLDEVDAPLDDANTDRYCKLVLEMSKGTQFLFISHNKIAMEMAQQLIGVTMQEQGVSRIVAVDMQTAVTMAQAA
ncbi:MAG: chromosome segregation protein SMC [Burkholderiaceae bacterium]